MSGMGLDHVWYGHSKNSRNCTHSNVTYRLRGSFLLRLPFVSVRVYVQFWLTLVIEAALRE
jgi:hypothetical protein